MIIVFGTRLYGKIFVCGKTFLATRFFHVFWLPLVPLGSRYVLDSQGDAQRYLAQPLSGLSVLAALLRTWGVLAAVAIAASGLSGFVEAMDAGATRELVVLPLSVFAAVSVVAAAFMQLGRLSADDRAQQNVYAAFVGHPIDVARFPEMRAEARVVITEVLARKSQTLGIFGYRNELPVSPDYPTMALEPAVTDSDFLRGSLTLARIQWAEARGPVRAERAAVHRAIWKKLQQRGGTEATCAAADGEGRPGGGETTRAACSAERV